MNQSETKAEPMPPMASSTIAGGSARRGTASALGATSDRRYGMTQVRYTSSRAIADTAEMVLTWWLAGSPELSDKPTSTMMKTVSNNSVAVSLGRRGEKRMIPSR